MATALTETMPELAATGQITASWRQDARAMSVVWRRELIRFSRDRTRLVSSLVQPVLYLLILGTGLSRFTRIPGAGIDYRTFIFPGVLAMAVQFTALFSAGSIVWDREFGFLREMLVAPVRRGAIVIGKCLGGATVATVQGMVMLSFAGVVHVPYSPLLLAKLVGTLLLLALTMTAIGIMIAARLSAIQSFMAVMQMFIMPLYFLSGAMFPLTGLPAWLTVLTRLNPLTYAIDPMRRIMFQALNVSPSVLAVFSPGVTWGDWRVPVSLELAIVATIGCIALIIAIREFNTAE